MVYIIGWLSMFVSAFFVSKKLGRFLSYSVLFYCAFIAFFRADVGTDTAAYINIVKMYKDLGVSPFGEIGFEILLKIISFIVADPVFTVKSVSIVFFGLLCIYLLKSNINERFFIVAYVLPMFAYAYSMNALRIGIAAAIFLLITQRINRQGFTRRNLLLSLFPAVFHYSALFYPVVFYTVLNRFLSKKLISMLSVFLLLIVFIFIGFSEYFLSKLELYSDYSKPSAFSGLRVVIPLLVVLSGFALGAISWKYKFKLIVSSFLLIIFSITLVQFSYAGLRFLDLLLLLVPTMVLYQYNKANRLFDRSIKLSFLLAAFVFSIGTYIGFLAEYGVGGSPFLPYRTIFN